MGVTSNSVTHLRESRQSFIFVPCVDPDRIHSGDILTYTIMKKELSAREIRILQLYVKNIKREYHLNSSDISRITGVPTSAMTALMKYGIIGKKQAEKLEFGLVTTHKQQMVSKSTTQKSISKLEKQVNTWSWILLTISVVVFLLALFIVL